MLEIKTITEERYCPTEFDRRVNDAIREGWELTRRDIFPDMFYAELEREVEPEEEEEPEDDSTAEWELVRDPVYPFRCSKCSCKSDEARKTCPGCGRRMEVVV